MGHWVVPFLATLTRKLLRDRLYFPGVSFDGLNQPHLLGLHIFVAHAALMCPNVLQVVHRMGPRCDLRAISCLSLHCGLGYTGGGENGEGGIAFSHLVTCFLFMVFVCTRVECTLMLREWWLNCTGGGHDGGGNGAKGGDGGALDLVGLDDEVNGT